MQLGHVGLVASAAASVSSFRSGSSTMRKQSENDVWPWWCMNPTAPRSFSRSETNDEVSVDFDSAIFNSARAATSRSVVSVCRAVASPPFQPGFLDFHVRRSSSDRLIAKSKLTAPFGESGMSPKEDKSRFGRFNSATTN